MNNKTKKFWRYIFRHALWFSIIGLIITGLFYFHILGLRNALVDGYFSNPALTTFGEITFWIMGGFIGLTIGAFFGWIKHNIYKKSKKH